MAPGNIQGGVYEAAVRKRWPSMLLSGDPSGGSSATTPTQAANLVRASSQYASIADASQTGLDITTGDFTLAQWIYFATLPGASESYSLMGKKTAIATGVGYLMHATATAGAVVTLRGSLQDAGGVTSFLSADSPFLAETLYSVVAAFDRDGNGSLFINGVASGTPASIATRSGTLENALAFTLGGAAAGANTHNGILSCGGIWPTLWTATEALLFHNGGSPLLGSALAGAGLTAPTDYWDLNGDLTSKSGLNTLTNNNSLTFVALP